MSLITAKSLLLVLIIALPFSTQARAESFQFESPQVESDYNQLISELRCNVCQNQTLAEANTQLAIDL